MKRTRIITAQGPCQLINVIAVLKYQKQLNKNSEFRDILILSDTRVTPQVHQEVKCMCESIAEIWPFSSIVDIDEEMLKYPANISFEQRVDCFRNLFPGEYIDCVYVCRNWQIFNEVVLNSFPLAHKVAYGDSFGILDLNGSGKINSPNGFVKVDEAFLFFPVEQLPSARTFTLVQKITSPPCTILIDLIREIAERNSAIKTYCQAINNLDSRKKHLVLTCCYTEARVLKSGRMRFFVWRILIKILKMAGIQKISIRPPFDPDFEIELYIEQVTRSCDKDCLIIVKGHPRQRYNQSGRVVEILIKLGYSAIELVTFARYPIELFACHIHFESVLAMRSTSAASLSLIDRNCKVLPLLDEDLRVKYFKPEFTDEFETCKNYYNVAQQSFLNSYGIRHGSDQSAE